MSIIDQKIGSILKKIGSVGLFQIGLYVLQYIIIPVLFKISPTDINGNCIIIIITTVLVSGVGIYYVTQLRYWCSTITLYYVLIQIYHPQNTYGLDYSSHIPFTRISVYVLTVLVLIAQIILYLFIKGIQRICKRAR